MQNKNIVVLLSLSICFLSVISYADDCQYGSTKTMSTESRSSRPTGNWGNFKP